MEYISTHLVEFLIVVGLGLLVVEVAVLGFSTFVLFFVGLASVSTGLLMSIGVIPEQMQSSLISMGIFTALFAVVLWRPLKRLQGKVSKNVIKHDFIGMEFVLETEVSPQVAGQFRYSGIDWQVKSEIEISSGKKVKVVNVDVGVLHIAPVD